MGWWGESKGSAEGRCRRKRLGGQAYRRGAGWRWVKGGVGEGRGGGGAGGRQGTGLNFVIQPLYIPAGGPGEGSGTPGIDNLSNLNPGGASGFNFLNSWALTPLRDLRPDLNYLKYVNYLIGAGKYII